MTPLVVLGVDAADYELVQRWGCNNLLLSHHSPLKTENYSLDVPATLEVWPTIATGLSPDQHGVRLEGVGWNSQPGLNQLVNIVNLFPKAVSDRLRLAKKIFIDVGESKPQTDVPHVFDVGQVTNWPGITPCQEWVQEGELFAKLNKGNITIKEFYETSLSNSGGIVGWVTSLAEMDVPIIGAHIHTLDHMGHIYADRPDQLLKVYKQVDSLIGIIVNRVDRVVILSDHGMQTAAVEEDEEYGVHSFRAMISSSFDDDLPGSAITVREWLEQHIETNEETFFDNPTSIDSPKEHLRDLGYL